MITLHLSLSTSISFYYQFPVINVTIFAGGVERSTNFEFLLVYLEMCGGAEGPSRWTVSTDYRVACCKFTHGEENIRDPVGLCLMLTRTLSSSAPTAVLKKYCYLFLFI